MNQGKLSKIYNTVFITLVLKPYILKDEWLSLNTEGLGPLLTIELQIFLFQ